MNAEDFPAAFWGKDARGGGVTPQGYELLARDSEFPDSALVDLESLSRAFAWNSRTDDVLPACFAYWPTAGGALLARLSDAGPDDQNRPHCLRIEAAFAAERPGASAGWFAQWLHRDAWPIGMCNFRRVTRLLLYQQAADRDFVRALEEHAGRPVLGAPHGEFSASDRFACTVGAPGARHPSEATVLPADLQPPSRPPPPAKERVDLQPVVKPPAARARFGAPVWVTYGLGASLVVSLLLLVANSGRESAVKNHGDVKDPTAVDRARSEQTTNAELKRLRKENERLKEALRHILGEVKNATSDPS